VRPRGRSSDGEQGLPRPEAPAELTELLTDVRELRLTLTSDLSAAAGALDAGAERLAAEILDADRSELARFTRQAMDQLAHLQHGDAAPAGPAAATRTWRRRALIALPAVPLAGALAMSAAAAAGLLPVPGHSSSSAHVSVHASTPVTSTFKKFETVVNSDPNASQVITAATELHQQIADLIATAPQDPSHVREVAQLLQLEQALLLRKQPPGSSVVLAASRKLAATLLHIVPTISPTTTTRASAASVPTTRPSTTTREESSTKPTATSSSTTKPSPTTSPSPWQSPSAPAQSPSQSPSPSSSPSGDKSGHIPGLGH
jgi:hypothetical protein